MILRYKFSKKPSRKTIKECDEGCVGMQKLMIAIAKTQSLFAVPVIWILTRFYVRKITSHSISYNFYLITTK